MEIRRDKYLNRLVKARNDGFVKVITGLRRVGKSYLLNNIFYGYLLSKGLSRDRIISFAFDSAEDLSKIGVDLLELEKEDKKVDPQKFLNYVSSRIADDGEYVLLLDEIQELDCFYSVLNGYLRKKNLDIYVTGSNAHMLSKDVRTEFSGRGEEIKIYPASFAEFKSAYQGNPSLALDEYMLHGGMPLVIQKDSAEAKEETLGALYEEIYIKDIKKRNRIRNVKQLEELLDFLSSSIGSLTNPEKLRKTYFSKSHSKITNQTIEKYLAALEDSFLIEESKRYDVKGKSYIETPKKYYFSDLGLRNAKLEFRQSEETHLMENMIYNELRFRGYRVDVGVVPATEGGKRKQLEVDFVARLGDKKYYIQSAYSIMDDEKRERELAPLDRIGDSFKKVLITHDQVISRYDQRGYLRLNLEDFLLDESALDR